MFLSNNGDYTQSIALNQGHWNYPGTPTLMLNNAVYSSPFAIVKLSLMMGPLLSRSYHSLSFKGGFASISNSFRNSNNPIQLMFNQLNELHQFINSDRTSSSSSLDNDKTNPVKSNQKLLHILNHPTQNAQLQSCLNLMGKVSLEDIGYHNINMNTIKDAHCVTAYSCPSFEIAAFIIPTGKVILIYDRYCLLIAIVLLYPQPH